MKHSFKHMAILLFAATIFVMACKKEHSCEGCIANNPNMPPIAVAGPDQSITLPTDNVLLDGIISEWQWTKISGPAFCRHISFHFIQERTLMYKRYKKNSRIKMQKPYSKNNTRHYIQMVKLHYCKLNSLHRY